MDTEAIITSGITSGSTYLLKVRAKNVYGWGPFSSSLSIVAATVPGAPSAPTTSYNGTKVKIAFADPTFTGGSSIAITDYQVYLKNSSGSFE